MMALARDAVGGRLSPDERDAVFGGFERPGGDYGLDLLAAIAPEGVAGHFTWLASFLGIHAPASSALTRELLGWQPVHPGLIDDLDKGHYFHE